MGPFYFDRLLQLVFFLVAAGAVSGPLCAYVWYRHKRTVMELELKRELLVRGMSASEIREVIEASQRRNPDPAELVEAKLI